mmetsp:Transcript_13443/g.39262  ORF Transcript_13443/g.39262 Transcript_13443/m.39262 type:complete len:543 (-) Transcript_13443:35-1663(-)
MGTDCNGPTAEQETLALHPARKMCPTTSGGTGEGEQALHAGAEAMAASRYEEAARCFTLALSLLPGFRQVALRARAQAYVALQELDAARLDADEAISLQPRSPLSHQVLGLVNFASGDYAVARENYRMALKHFPGSTPSSLRGYVDVERFLLMSSPVAENYRTCNATGWSINEAWDFCVRSLLASLAVSIRQFALLFRSQGKRGASMPYLLTVPADVCAGSRCGSDNPRLGSEKRYPLIVYLHSAASTDICKGNVLARQLQFVAQEAPHSAFVENGSGGPVDGFIGIAPCCPPNLACIAADMPKAYRRRKVYWFKSCETFAYANWDFSAAMRCHEVELLVVELLAHVCESLPVDPSQIYFVGSSCGGYAVLRLGELVPELPAAIVAMAGYYPDIPGQDHDASVLADRLRGVRIWPMHCDKDKLCRPDSPHVARLYEFLEERNGVKVEWVSANTAKGPQGNFHSAHRRIFENPEVFFDQLGRLSRPAMQDAPGYLRRRLAELTPAPAAPPVAWAQMTAAPMPAPAVVSPWGSPEWLAAGDPGV